MPKHASSTFINSVFYFAAWLKSGLIPFERLPLSLVKLTVQAKMKKGIQSHNISLMACLLNAVTEGQYFAHEIEHMLL